MIYLKEVTKKLNKYIKNKNKKKQEDKNCILTKRKIL